MIIDDDLEKLDAIQDDFTHYHLLRFCQSTRMQYLNSHILLGNRCTLQLQHVDCKIADTLLKKGTKQHTDVWDSSSKAWAHMVLHLPHVEGGFGVTFNDITKNSAFYTTTSQFVAWLGALSQERQNLWCPRMTSWTLLPGLPGLGLLLCSSGHPLPPYCQLWC